MRAHAPSHCVMVESSLLRRPDITPQHSIHMQRAPHPTLARFIQSVWISAPAAGPTTGPGREHVMPTGLMHLVFRLSGPAVKIFRNAGDETGEALGHAVVGGTRSVFYAKDIAAPSHAMGVQLLPGAAQALLALPADELAGRHVRLEDLWGRDAGLIHEQLLAAESPAEKLHTFETLLHRRLAPSQPHALNPAVVRALLQLRAGLSVREVAAQSGYSHRQFIHLFAQAVGLNPKLYCRVNRFQKALRLMQPAAAAGSVSLATVAMDAGYSDQAHFSRDFREFSGVTPEQYRRARPAFANHLPVPA